ncbi:hypothetical protein [Actinoplanes subtropicus]|nr:hypothetical protein [Actinoplanes subtropicus]
MKLLRYDRCAGPEVVRLAEFEAVGPGGYTRITTLLRHYLTQKR